MIKTKMELLKIRDVPTHKNTAASTYIMRFEDYFNNFLTVQGFASYHRINIKLALKNIKKGKVLRQSYFSSIIEYVI